MVSFTTSKQGTFHDFIYHLKTGNVSRFHLPLQNRQRKNFMISLTTSKQGTFPVFINHLTTGNVSWFHSPLQNRERFMISFKYPFKTELHVKGIEVLQEMLAEVEENRRKMSNG